MSENSTVCGLLSSGYACTILHNCILNKPENSYTHLILKNNEGNLNLSVKYGSNYNVHYVRFNDDAFAWWIKVFERLKRYKVSKDMLKLTLKSYKWKKKGKTGFMKRKTMPMLVHSYYKMCNLPLQLRPVQNLLCPREFFVNIDYVIYIVTLLFINKLSVSLKEAIQPMIYQCINWCFVYSLYFDQT